MRLHATLVLALASCLATAAPVAGGTVDTVQQVHEPSPKASLILTLSPAQSDAGFAVPTIVPLSRRADATPSPGDDGALTPKDTPSSNAIAFLTGMTPAQTELLFTAFNRASIDDNRDLAKPSEITHFREEELEVKAKRIHRVAIRSIFEIHLWALTNADASRPVVSAEDARRLVESLEELRAAIGTTRETDYRRLKTMFERLDTAQDKELVSEWKRQNFGQGSSR
ncbi:MAG: hypothetical protein M1829_005247 [Trizodia sp. TS-e1964]|nr:MAG: hypothetical protein M1829_005247 [Trizodia sp. TS-e1964]